jgi:hypothetical protein
VILHPTSPPRRRLPRLIVAALLVALAAQTALPALHALRTAGPADPAALALASDAPRVIESPSASPAPQHDPASCAVCRSLVRGNGAPPAASCPEPGTELEAPPAARPQAAYTSVALDEHRPRGPPADPSLLV